MSAITAEPVRTPVRSVLSTDPPTGLTAAPRTAQVLRTILTSDLRCRRRWQRHARRNPQVDVHQAAVATVLALQLWETGEVSEGHRTLPRRLKDRVSRALQGRGVSAPTLQLFVEAFQMTDEQEQQLFTAWEQDYGGRSLPPLP